MNMSKKMKTEISPCVKRGYISIATTRPETMSVVERLQFTHLMNDMRQLSANSARSCRSERVPPPDPDHHDPYPDPTFGSGAVKITGAHDFNDYQVAKRGGVLMYNLMDTKGAMRADGKPYAEQAKIAQAIAMARKALTKR